MMKEYETSQDYEHLKKLLDEGYKVICLWTIKPHFPPSLSIAEKDAFCYYIADTRTVDDKDFAFICAKRHLEYIEPRKISDKVITLNRVEYKEVQAPTDAKICKECDYFLDNGSCELDECPCKWNDTILERLNKEK